MSDKKYPLLVARMWWCEDEVCDCTQPIIERVSQNPIDPRFFTRERLWEGQFISQDGGYDDDELAMRRDEFTAKAADFGIALDETLRGERPE